MQYFISVMDDRSTEYAHVIEADSMASAKLTVEAMHAKTVGSRWLNRPVLVHEDGRVAVPGSDLVTFRGEEWVMTGSSVPDHAGSTGRVHVRQECTGCKGPGEHQHWCDGDQEASYFPGVFGLSWIIPSDYEYADGRAITAS